MKNKILPILVLGSGLILLGLHFFRNSRSGSLDLKMYPAAYIMPGAYKVYENPQAQSGRYHLFKSVITNNGSKTLKDVVVSYRVPNFIDWTDIKEIPAILPGQTVIVTCYPKFKPEIVEKKTSSKETGEIKITASGKQKRKESFPFELKGVNDFVYSGIPTDDQASYSDVFDNANLFSCYVTPNDPIVKYYTANIQEKVLKGETAGVTGDIKEAVRFLMGIYEATRRSGMVYSSTGGVPVKIGDVSSLKQDVRIPREVITGNTGLCIELSLLYASVLANAGLEPYIFLIPGHAYPGFKMNGQFVAIEATGIGGAGIGGIMTADQALDKGMKELDEFIKAAQMGDERYKLIDINSLIEDGVVPMELKDDPFLRKKVDDIAARFESGSAPRINTQNQQVLVNTTRQNNNNNQSSGGGLGASRYSGSVSFGYPQNWSRRNNPVQGLNYLKSSVYSPDQMASVEVYNFSGYTSIEDAFDQLEEDGYLLGLQISAQLQGKAGSFQKISGRTTSQNGVFVWTGFFKVKGNSVVGIAAGAYSNVYNQYQGTLSTILSSLK